MRSPAPLLFFFGSVLVTLATGGCEHLDTGTGSGADAGAAGTEPGAASDAGVVGGGCGLETSSGAELCAAISSCPNVVVDTQAMPRCGFRVRGGAVDLVCACGTALCPMGLFTTCAEAAQLLASQTEQGVCVQLAEDRCFETSSPAPPSSSGGNPACDRDCVTQCGGGAACASVCNCD